MGSERAIRRRGRQPLRVQQVGALAHAPRGRVIGRGAAEPAAAQRQAAGPGSAPARRHLRGPRRGSGRARVLCEARQVKRSGPPARSRLWLWRARSTISAASKHARREQFASKARQETRSTTMAVPKRKISPSRRGMRRSADALARPTYVEDKDSGELRRPHHIDLKTGMYRGRQVLKAKKEV